MLYTRTSTINLFNALNVCLMELDWPFPAYIDLRKEMEKPLYCGGPESNRWQKFFKRIKRHTSLKYVVLMAAIAKSSDEKEGLRLCDDEMASIFDRHRIEFFSSLFQSHILQPKRQILQDIEKAYCKKMWAACISTTYPLLDYIIRNYFTTEKINVSIQVLRNAYFEIAKLQSKDLMPGNSIWDGKSNPEKGNTFAKTVEEDLRLPGIFLSSFFSFSDIYYGWYKSTKAAPQTPLNRHAIIHCSSEYWTKPNAVKILTFLDLTIRLELVLKILIQGERAMIDQNLQNKI